MPVKLMMELMELVDFVLIIVEEYIVQNKLKLINVIFHINELLIGTWKCIWCDFIGNTKKELNKHIHNEHHIENSGKSHIAWNKGLNKNNNKILKQMGETYRNKVLTGKIIPPQTGKPLSEEHKKAISKSMIQAHIDGRAYYIGKNDRNQFLPSYPEKYFKKYIDNEFLNKNYKQEFHILSYYLDFAWPELMKYIEIDGEQHYRTKSAIEHDKIRTEKLNNLGWTCLRIKWIDLLHDSKKWIQIAKDFIDS